MANGIIGRSFSNHVPHATNELPVGTVAIQVGVGGTLDVEGWDGSTATIATVDGQVLPCSPKLILATSTATSITVFGGEAG